MYFEGRKKKKKKIIYHTWKREKIKSRYCGGKWLENREY